MTYQYSTAIRNAQLDQVESTIGTSAKLRIYTGSEPANCAAAPTGTLLVDMALPSDWMNDASGGTKTLKGTWTGTASNTGTAGYFRVWDSGVTTCGIQGSVGQGSGDLSLDNTSINSGQTVNITTFTITAGNA